MSSSLSVSIPTSTYHHRIENTAPNDYRLAIKNGQLVLQGKYYWFELTTQGYEWRDIPTVNLDHCQD